MHYTDQTYLREMQYKDASNLDARITLHRRFGERAVNWHRWLFDRYDVPEKSRVLELGCGPGTFWLENEGRIPEGWDVTLSDLSAGMLKEAKERLKSVPHHFEFAEIDAQEIPFEDNRFDMVMANQVFHHIPDANRALQEIRCVLKPGGRVYIGASSRAHLQELSELAAHFMDEVSLRAFRETFGSQPFKLEEGERLFKTHFGEVTLHLLKSNDLFVTEAEPLIAFILSMNSSEAFKEQLKEEVAKRLEAFRSYLEKRIADEGSIHITRAVGLLEAHSPK